jgi:hypothetical protein
MDRKFKGMAFLLPLFEEAVHPSGLSLAHIRGCGG